MLHDRERAAIDALWTVKISQDARDLPQAQRCRNLEPDSAEFICALAAGHPGHALLEIGGSSGISTIALAAAARQTGGRLVSLEIEPARQAESQRTLADLGLADRVDYVLADAGTVLDRYADLQFVLIDCEKDDYIRFFDGCGSRRAPWSSPTTSCRTGSGTTSATSAPCPASSR